jgi:holo-[acyl-carrier protein] synthase
VCGAAGIDIISVSRIARLINEHGDDFLRRWFTPAEIEYCIGKAVPSRHFAARLAAKEAVAKLLPGEWEQPVPWRSIEIVKNGHGQPGVRLSGFALEVAQRSGVGVIRVSLSHCDEYATAVAIAGCDCNGGTWEETAGKEPDSYER